MNTTTYNIQNNIQYIQISEDIRLFQQDALVQKAINQGVDLREYSKQIQLDLKRIEMESIDDYLEEAERLADLYVQLRTCDSVLEKMEQMLATFQGSLGDTAEEIKKLQDQSFTMNIKLSNRRKAVVSLSEFLSKIVIPPRLIQEITGTSGSSLTSSITSGISSSIGIVGGTFHGTSTMIDDRYLSPLLELDALLENFQQVDRRTPVFEELEPQLTNLTKSAVSRLKVFMENKMRELSSGGSGGSGGGSGSNHQSNVASLQFSLLRYKYFYDFLEKYSPQVTVNIRKLYTSTLSSHYLNSFKNYVSSLQKRFPKAFVSESVKNNTIVELSTFSLTNLTSSVTSFSLGSLSNNMSSLWSSAEKASKTEKFFDLGDRFEKIDNNCLISFDMSPQNAELVDYTELWTSTFVLLLNTISSEYSFLLNFFTSIDHTTTTTTTSRTTTATPSTATSSNRANSSSGGSSVRDHNHEITSEIFSMTFSSSFSYLFSFTESYSSQTWDSIGVLLLIRKIGDFREMMKRRDIHQESLNQFWQQLEGMLWERFNLIYEKNVISVQQLVDNDYKAIVQNKNLVSREKSNFIISKKFAQWVTSIYRLGLGQKLDKDLIKLSETYKDILIQMGRCSKNAKLGGDVDHVLIINCVDQVLGLFIAYGIENDIARLFGNFLNEQVEQLLFRILNLPNIQMSKLISFLSMTQRLVSADKSRETNRQALSTDIVLNGVKKSAYVHFETVINEFNTYWAGSLSQMHAIINSQFTNVGTARNIMERAVISWMKYYRQFSQMVEAVFGKSSGQLVAEGKVTLELRKYTSSNADV